jgi:cytochrome c oxidase subunit 2
MEPAAYERWLSSGAPSESMTASGLRLFQQFDCTSCHQETNTSNGPSLVGLFGKTEMLRGGRHIVADEAYLRNSILNPRAEILAGYQPLMPTYQGQLNEEQLLQLIAYIKSLGTPERKTK